LRVGDLPEKGAHSSFRVQRSQRDKADQTSGALQPFPAGASALLSFEVEVTQQRIVFHCSLTGGHFIIDYHQESEPGKV
jgi:hypothetical protein